jgi:hypothetical protein
MSKKLRLTFLLGALIGVVASLLVFVVVRGIPRAELNAQLIFLTTELGNRSGADNDVNLNLAKLIQDIPNKPWQDVGLIIDNGRVWNKRGNEFRLVKDTVSGDFRIWIDPLIQNP